MLTTADERVNEAKEAINVAAKAISEVIIEDCYGSDEYTEDFKRTLRECMNNLLSLKMMLND